MEAIYGYLAESADADMAFSYFEDFLINSTAKSTIFELLASFNVVGEILFGIFSQSNTLSSYLINNTQKIFWLIENETLSVSKTKENFYDEIFKLIKNIDSADRQDFFLRQYRKEEYLRIASREIIEACDFTQIMKELSNLANALIEAALWCAEKRLKKRYGYERNGICVIGMGKLGNLELNFSSDIDLLFVHSEEKYAEYYNRLAKEVISILNDNKEGGFVYRVDMRLRPGGRAAALSLSVEEYENYYSTFGQLWERMALVKAHHSAGDNQLADEFLETIEPFVYKKSLDLEYIEAIRSLMFKIKKYSKTTIHSEFIPVNKIDVKKGSGGIREIEFIVNYFQLIYGGREKRLRHISTVGGLNILEEKGYIDNGSSSLLKEAYLFFRKIEHKIQLLDERQTQSLPVEKENLEKLAKKLGMSFEEFTERYNNITDKVHSIFNSIFIRDDKIPVFGTVDDIEAFLFEYDIEDAQMLSYTIKETVKKFLAKDIKRKLIEDIFDYSFKFVKKDMLANCFKGFSFINPIYTVTMFENKKLFDVFLKMLSVNLHPMLARNSEVFEYLAASDRDIAFSNFEKKDYEKAVLIAIFDFFANPLDYNFDIFNEFTLGFIKNTAKKYDRDNNLCIVGYGKSATGELFIGSDLDLVFIARKNSYLYTSSVQKIIKELSSLYDVDLRLRPYGEKGSIVSDLDYLCDYFAKSARAWEKQAAQKSRIIYCGFDKDEVEELYKKFIITKHPTRLEMLEMKSKIEKTKGRIFDIKSVAGGITDIEFLAQSVCFENGCIKIGKSCLELLDIIEKMGLMDVEILRKTYVFYTSILNFKRVSSKGSVVDDFETIEFLSGFKDIRLKIEKYRKSVKKMFDDWFVSC